MNRLRWTSICRQGERLHVARAVISARQETEPHSHDFYECFAVEAGRGWHLVGGKRQRLEAGDWVGIRPEDAHTFRSAVDAALCLINVAVEAAVATAFIERHAEVGLWQAGRGPVVRRLDPAQLAAVVRLAMEAGEGERSGVDADYFLAGLARTVRDGSGGSQGPMAGAPAWLREALPVAREPAHLQGGVPRLVRLCGRTPEHVARAFRRFLGETPTAWLNRAKLERAKRLLEQTGMPVMEVAFECGIGNLSHFHRRFKATYGETPLACRRRAARSIRG